MPLDAQCTCGTVGSKCGGPGFVLATAQMNAYLIVSPQWITALYLTAALVGLAGWNTPLGTRIGLAVCLFLAGFALVGQRFNQYWGFMVRRFLCFGVAILPFDPRPLPRGVFRNAIAVRTAMNRAARP